MRFLIINTDYPYFLGDLYELHSRLHQRSYEEQYRIRMDSLFGISQYYAANLRKLGHQAWDVYANNRPMQLAWANEHGLGNTLREWRLRLRHNIVPWPSRALAGNWSYRILAAQINHYQPDVILVHAMDWINSQFLAEIKSKARLVIGQHAATRLPAEQSYSPYDLVISSFQPTLAFFHGQGIQVEYHALGFEASLLEQFASPTERHNCAVFVGSLSSVHKARRIWLETLCKALPSLIQVWTPNLNTLDNSSPIRDCFAGIAWGRKMYQLFLNSKLTLNHHGSIPPFANNLRLYEATGMGTLLITDWKRNLSNLFNLGSEVVAYESAEECIDQIQYYLSHEEEREAIAHSGQQRTLNQHTFYHRMQELIDIVQRYI